MVVLDKKMRFDRRVRLIVAHREGTGRTLGAVVAFPHWQRSSGSPAACSPRMMPMSIPAGLWLNSLSGPWKGGNVNIFLSRSCEFALPRPEEQVPAAGTG